jgi:hypothetical protein
MNLKNLALSLSIFAFGAVNAQNEGDDFFTFNQMEANYFSFNQTLYWDYFILDYYENYYELKSKEVSELFMLNDEVYLIKNKKQVWKHYFYTKNT